MSRSRPYRPMQAPITAPWGLTISDADFEKLKAGFEPQDQWDKWRVEMTDQSQSQSGIVSIHIILCGKAKAAKASKASKEMYVLAIKPSDPGSSTGGVNIEAITWEQNKTGIRISEEQAKKEVVLLTRMIMKCEFNGLPEYDTSITWTHGVK